MNDATFWTAVGSVGTAAGSCFALFAVVLTAILYRRQRNDEHAARIREDIRGFISATNGLIRALKDGSPFIAAAWSARAVIQDSLPPNSNVQNLREALTTGDIGLSVAVVSWERSSEAEALRGRASTLVDSVRRMTGTLNILSASGEMLISIADDAKMTFLRLLTNQQVLVMFLEENKNITEVNDLLNALAKHLHGNTAMYFVARYEQALNLLDALVTEAAMALGEVDSAGLLKAAKAKTAITTNTRTAEMRMHLSALTSLLPEATSKKLGLLIDQVEQSVSKDSAHERLAGKAQQGVQPDGPASGGPAG